MKQHCMRDLNKNTFLDNPDVLMRKDGVDNNSLY